MGDSPGTVPGPILAVSGTVEELTKLRDSLREQIASFRTAIAEGQAEIAADQAKAQAVQSDADKAFYAKQIADLRTTLAEKRAAIAQANEDIQRLSKDIPKVPLKVEIQGISKEAISILRDEFGGLLGPLNGVTGRISSLISLMTLLGKAGREGAGEAADAIKKVQVTAEGASVATKVLGAQHLIPTPSTAGVDKAAEDIRKKFEDLAKQVADIKLQPTIQIPIARPSAPGAVGAASAEQVVTGEAEAAAAKQTASLQKLTEANAAVTATDVALTAQEKQKAGALTDTSNVAQTLAASETLGEKATKGHTAATAENANVSKGAKEATEANTAATIAATVASQKAAENTGLFAKATALAREGAASLGVSLEAFVAIGAVVATGIAVIGTALFEFGKESGEAAKNFTLLGERIGATGQEIQGLALVAKSGGTSLEELVLSLSRFSFALTGHGAAAGGAGSEEGVAGAAGKAQNAVQFLIGSIHNANGQFLPSIEIFKRLADVFAAAPDGIEKTSLAMELFGRQGQQLIPVLNKGSAGINELIQKANELGITVDQEGVEKFERYEQAVGAVSLAWDKFKQALGEIGVFTAVTAALESVSSALDFFANAAGAAGRRYKSDFLKIISEKPQGIDPKDPLGLGLNQYTEKSKATAKAVADELGRVRAQTEHPIATFFGPEPLFGENIPGISEEQSNEVQQRIQKIVEETNKIQDPIEKENAYHRETLALLDELRGKGELQRVDQEELNRLLADGVEKQKALAFAAGGGSQALAKQAEENQKLLDKTQEADLKLGVLGDRVGTAWTQADIPIGKLQQNLRETTAQIDSVTKRIQELQDASRRPQNIGGIGVTDEQRRKSTQAQEIELGLQQKQLASLRTQQEQNLAAVSSATEKAISQSRELAKEYQNLIKELTELNQRFEDQGIKELSAGKQVEEYSSNVAEATTKLEQQLSAFEKLTSRLPGAQSAYLDLANAQTRVVEANKAVADAQTRDAAQTGALQARLLSLRASLNDVNVSQEQRNRTNLEIAATQEQLDAQQEQSTRQLDALKAARLDANRALDAAIAVEFQLAKGNKDQVDGLKAYEQALKNARTQQEAFDAAKRAQAAADKANFEAGNNLLKSFGDLTAKTHDLQKELSEVGDKQKTLPDQVAHTVAEIQKEATEIQRLTAALAQLKAEQAGGASNQGQINATQQQLNDAYRKQIENTKQLAGEQEELKKSTITVASAWKDFSEVIQGFGVALPKSLVRVVAMIEAVVKLTKAIEAYKAAQEAAKKAQEAGIGLKEQGGHVAEGGKSVGEQVAALSESPQVKTEQALVTATVSQRASTDANTAALQSNTAALQASAAGGTTNLAGAPSPGLTENIPFSGHEGPGGVGTAAEGLGGETQQLPAQIPGGGGGGGVAGLLGGAGGPAVPTIGLVTGGAGLGANLGQKIGGTLGEAGGALVGGSVGLAAAGALFPAIAASVGFLGPIGALIGAALLAIGIVKQKLDAEAATIAKHIEEGFKAITKAYQDGAVTLNQTIQEVTALQQQSIEKLSGKKGGGTELFKLLPQFAQQLAQLEQQSQQTIKQFDTDLGATRFALGIQSTISQLQQLNQQVQDFINAGGSASQAAEFLARSLNSIEVSTQTDLLNTEQGVVNLLLQQIQLRQQAAQLIHDEAQQEKDILNAGVISRTRSVAQNQALQILQLRQQRDLQLKDINNQIAQNQAQIGNAQQLFGLTLNQNDLLKDQVEIQTELTNQTNLQVAAEQKLLLALEGIAPGGTQIDLTKILQLLGGPNQVPGLPNPTGGPTNVPFDSSAFLAQLESNAAGVKELERLFKTVPTQITQAQEQQVIADIQNRNVGALKPTLQTLQDIMQQEIATQKQLQNALPGGASPSLPYQPLTDQLSASQTATTTNTSAVQDLTSATQEQTAAVRAASGQAAPSAGSAGSTAAVRSAAVVPVVGSVSDALSSNQVVPVAVVGGSLDSVGQINTDVQPVAGGGTGGGSGPASPTAPTSPAAPTSPTAPATPTAPTSPGGTVSNAPPPSLPATGGPSEATGAIIAQIGGYQLYGHDSFGAPVYINGATGELYNSLGEPLSPSTQVSPLLANVPGGNGTTAGGPGANPLPPVTGPGTNPPTPTPGPVTGPQPGPVGGPLPGSPAEPQIPTIGIVQAKSHPAQVQVDAAIELINEIITAYNNGTLDPATALAQITTQEGVLKAALQGVRQGGPSFTAADAAIQAAKAALQQAIDQQNAPTTIQNPSGPIQIFPAGEAPNTPTSVEVATAPSNLPAAATSSLVSIDTASPVFSTPLSGPGTIPGAPNPANVSPTNPLGISPVLAGNPVGVRTFPTPPNPGQPPGTTPNPVGPINEQATPLGPIHAGSHPAQVDLDAAIASINSVVQQFNTGAITSAAAITQITALQTQLAATLSDVRKGTPTLKTADPLIDALIAQLTAFNNAPRNPPPIVPTPPIPPGTTRGGSPPPTGPPVSVACPGIDEEFTAPFLPLIQAASNLISVGTGGTPATPPVAQPQPPGLPTSPIITPPPIHPVGPEPVFPRLPISGPVLPPVFPVGGPIILPTPITPTQPPTEPTPVSGPINFPKPLEPFNPKDPFGPILAQKLDSIQAVLATAAKSLPSAAAGSTAISVGSVTVQVQGTTNMSSAQLQDAVTKGLMSGFNELRSRRGVNPVGS